MITGLHGWVCLAAGWWLLDCTFCSNVAGGGAMCPGMRCTPKQSAEFQVAVASSPCRDETQKVRLGSPAAPWKWRRWTDKVSSSLPALLPLIWLVWPSLAEDASEEQVNRRFLKKFMKKRAKWELSEISQLQNMKASYVFLRNHLLRSWQVHCFITYLFATWVGDCTSWFGSSI